MFLNWSKTSSNVSPETSHNVIKIVGCLPKWSPTKNNKKYEQMIKSKIWGPIYLTKIIIFTFIILTIILIPLNRLNNNNNFLFKKI